MTALAIGTSVDNCSHSDDGKERTSGEVQRRVTILEDIVAACPCSSFKNHGDYKSCMADAVHGPSSDIPKNERGEIMREAAKSRCLLAPLIVVGNILGKNQLILDNGNASFPFLDPPLDLPGGSSRTFSVAVGDVNNDGWLDIVLGNWWQANQLLIQKFDGTFPNYVNLPGEDMQTINNHTVLYSPK